MAANKFKFVSPGVFINEIDQSQTARQPEDIGPVVIGRSLKGPMMRPVKVNTFTDFEALFGAPVPGASNADVWREGNKLAPTYGAYAAEAYLTNAGPLTFVRLGGVASGDADTSGVAGWSVKSPDTSSLANNGGAYGLFVAGVEEYNTVSLFSTIGTASIEVGTNVINVTASDASLSGTMAGKLIRFVSGSVDAFEQAGNYVKINSIVLGGSPATGAITVSEDATTNLSSSYSTSGATLESYKYIVTGSAQLASVIYLDGGSVKLTGEKLTDNTITSAAGLWIKSSDSTTKQFKLKVSRSGGEVTKNVNFSKENKLFIRNVLNTNPTKTNAEITTVDGLENYWLGETYETELTELSASAYAGIIVALASGSVSAGNFKKDMEEAKTGWVFSQHLNDAPTWDASSLTGVKNLFCFHVLAEDEWTQKNVKVSIQDIKLPVNAYTDYGTFSVVVRDINDTDDQTVILERFDQCNLDPSSPNYVAKKIGDINMVWDEANKKFIEYGQYENKSRFVRIEMDPEIDGNGGAGLLPFGFYGPLKYKDSSVLSGLSGSVISVTGDSGSMLSTAFYGAESFSGIKADADVDASFKFPTLPTVASNSSADHYIRNASSLYWGLKTGIGSSKKFNKSLVDYTRTSPVGVAAVNTEYAFIFTLDEISGSADYKSVAWNIGSRLAGTSYTAQPDAEDYSPKLAEFLSKAGKFTLPLVGGFEGLDVTEKEPFGNHVLAENDEITSYAVNSIVRAIEGVADPEVVEMNALVVPGVAKARIHNKMIDTCEARGDSLAIIDLEGDYTPVTQLEPDTNPSGIKPNVASAVSYVKDTLAPNTSYGCTFFPWVMTVDNRDGNKVWIPSSIVALGTFGSTKRFSEVWFAPAGFTRGGLSANNAGGLPVVQTSLKLNSKDRDALYESNINPIASFPAEGIVIFGQKTLQATPSALDRINVRRMMNYVKKEVSRIASTVLFDQNEKVTWARFLSEVEPFLSEVKSGLGLTDFKVVLDETTTTPELIDRNILYAKIFLKPARAIEYIALDFTITNSGASFAD